MLNIRWTLVLALMVGMLMPAPENKTLIVNAHGRDENPGRGHAYGHYKDNKDKKDKNDKYHDDDNWDDDDDWDDDWDGGKGGKGRWHDKDRHGNRSISLVQVQHMDFGMLPAGGTRCALKSNQNLVGDCIGNGVLGEMEVRGKPYYAYNVVVQELGWKKNRRLIPKLKRQDYYLDRNGRDIIYVRGVLEFKPGKVRPGNATFTYLITVNYQ